jgi:type IV secretory pathway TrbF-like protein
MHEFTQKRESLSYRYGPINTPFQSVYQNEDRELGRYVKAAKFWRSFCLFCLVGAFLLLFFSFLEILFPRIQVFGVDILNNGFVKEVGFLMEQPTKP